MTARKPPAPPGRRVIAQNVLRPGPDGGYLGELAWWAYRYGVEVRRHADGVEVTVFEEVGRAPGVPAAYRQPAIDGEIPCDPDEVLASITYHPADGEAA